jgi:Zn-dependent protease
MADWINWPPSWSTLLLLPALFVAFTVHELAHAVVAYLLGDTSQVERNRLSFNPVRHVSWVGMAVFLLFRFGWAKPVVVDHTRFRIKNRAFGMFLVSISGAAANLLTALLVLVGMSATVTIVWITAGASPVDVMDFMMAPDPGLDLQGAVVALSYYMMMVNLLLAFFNLIPIPPLDGFQAMFSLFAALNRSFRQRLYGEPAPQAAAPEAAGGEEDLSPAQIHFQIALDYQREGQWDEAIVRYRQATAHDDQFALAYYNLGLAYWAKGRYSLASSAFRAAVESGTNLPVRVQADLRLQELVQAEESRTGEPGPPPPPLEPGEAVVPGGGGPPPLDPVVARRIWLRLAAGGTGALALAVSSWLFVTAAALVSLG